MTKTILITGGSIGFGRDTAETLARAGHKVFASMRDPQVKNRAHADTLRGQNIDVVELDVTDSQSIDRAVAGVIAKAGRIDVPNQQCGRRSGRRVGSVHPRAGHCAVRRQRDRPTPGDSCGSNRSCDVTTTD